MAQNTTTDAPDSATILSIIGSGHEVVMWYCDDKHTRENINPGDPVKIHLRAPEGNEPDQKGTCIEYRTRAGEIISDGREVGQPKIDNLVKQRQWSVDKQH